MLRGKFNRNRVWLVVTMLVLTFSAMVSANGAFAGVKTGNVPAGAGSSANPPPQSAQKPGPTTPFDCSMISRLGLDKQLNFHAAELLAGCGYKPKVTGATAPGSSRNTAGKLFRPLIGGTDGDAVTPDGTYPRTVQSEDMVWAHGSTIVVNYNDSRTNSACYAGISYSTDSGATWHPSQQLCTGHGTNYGDPIVVWDNAHNHWVAGDLATGCGGQGIGMWTSPDGITWSVGSCAA